MRLVIVEVASVVVELRCRIYMTSHLSDEAVSDDIIGSIYSGYVPFHRVELIATAFSGRGCVID